MSVATYTYEALPAAEKKVLPKEQIRAEYRTTRGHWDESGPAMTRTDDIAIRAPNVFIL